MPIPKLSRGRAKAAADPVPDLESLRSRTPTESSGYLLWRTTLGWQRLIRRVLEPYGVTQVQFSLMAVIWWLDQAGDEATQRRAATEAGIDEMMTSQVLRRLETAGLINRTTSARDARARIVKLTDKGRQTLAGALVDVQALDDEFFGYLGRDEGDFRGALDRLVVATDRMSDPKS